MDQPLETDRLMMDSATNVAPNGNGYVMHERHQPLNSSVIFEEGEKTTPSQKSYRSNDSAQSNTDIARYDRDKLQSIGVLGKSISLCC